MSIKRTIITTILALALVAVTVPAVSAQTPTIESLMAMIQQLTAQLAALQGGTATPGTQVGTGFCTGVTFTRTLPSGSTGSDVKCLQSILNSEGIAQQVTGTVGPHTIAGIRTFQTTKMGITATGTVGLLTRAALTTAMGKIVVTPGTPGTPAATGPVAAMVASTSPTSGALINSQATADLLHIAFSGSGTVTSVTLQRSGISDQNTLTNVYLFDGATRITDGYSFNVAGQMVINGLNIAVNGMKTISVKADLASNASINSSIAVALTNFTANGTATSANVQGTTMMIVAGSAATTTLSANSVGAANVNAGTTGYTFWSAPIQVNTRAVMLKTANFRMIGSAPSDALSNIKMFVDGVDTGKVATIMSITGSNYASFDLTSAPLTLTTGSHTIDLRADVQKGTNRDVTISVQQASDLTITDPQVGVNVAVGGTVPNAAGKISILTGSTTVVIDPAFTAQTNVSGGAANAVIARYKVHAYGEDVKISSLVVTPKILAATSTGATCTTDGTTGLVTTANGTCGMNNVTLYFNGSQVGSTANWAPTTASLVPMTFQLGSQMIAPAGQDSIIEVRADLQTAANVSYTGGNLSVTIGSGTNANAQGQSSQQTVFVPGGTSAGTQATTGLTISTATVVVAQNNSFSATGQVVSPNTTGVKIGSYTIQNQNTSEAIRLTSLKLQTWVDGNTTPVAATYITDLSALRTSDTTGSGATPIQPTGLDTFSINNTVAPGASINIDIFANVGSATASPEYIRTNLQVTSIGVISNITAYTPTSTTYTTGQVVQLGVGTMSTPTLVVSSSTPAQYIASGANGATNASQASFNFVSTSGSATVNEVKFLVAGATTASQICVGSICGSPVGGYVYLTGLNLSVPNGGSGLAINAQTSYPPVGTGGLSPNTTSLTSLAYVKYTAGGTVKTLGTSAACTATIGTTCTTNLAATTIDAKTMTLVGSVPTVSVTQSTPASGLILGAENKIGEVTVTANAAGAIKVNTITFNIGTSGFTSGPSWSGARLANGSTTIPGITCTQTTNSKVTCVSSTNTYAGDYLIGAGQSQVFSLYANTGSTTITAGNVGGVSTSVAGTTGFVWDDTSANGSPNSTSGGVGLDGTLIYNFPTNSYSIHQ